MINLYRDKLSEYDLVRIVCEKYSDYDKLNFIQQNNLTKESISIIFSSLSDKKIKIDYIEDNIERIDGFNIVIILKT
ncbi:MAG: hypothetical protein IJR82_03950 [Bacilli bacterium]|nr:hypothetical protein [Bacilli bacterium]